MEGRTANLQTNHRALTFHNIIIHYQKLKRPSAQVLVEEQIKLAWLENGQHFPAGWDGWWGQWQPLSRTSCAWEPLRAQYPSCRDFRMSDKYAWLLFYSLILSRAIERPIKKGLLMSWSSAVAKCCAFSAGASL